jgi:hypothetical protein
MMTPWKNASQAGAYLGGRSRRFVNREIKAGKLKAAKIGGRGEYITRDEWLDEYAEQQTVPVMVTVRRRTG